MRFILKNLFYISILLLGSNTFAQSLSDNSRGNGFNPAIGLNALTIYKNSSRDNDHDGFSLQEAELQFSADVDAYFRAEATFAVHKEHHEEGGEEEHGYAFEPEEVFAETISIPDFTVKLGKFYAQFGKYNMVHTHAQPFIYRGLVQEYMFGEEGLNEAGVSVSYLAPLPWYSDLTVQFLQPTNEELFVEDPHSITTVANLKNLWDLSESLTLEWGLSGLYFEEQAEKSTVLGTDLTLKWRPVKKGKYSSFVWSTEFIHKDVQGTNEVKNGGYSTFLRYQFAPRWFAQAQYEFLGVAKDESIADQNAYTALLAFVPTEFSAVRMQYDEIHDGEDRPEKRVSLQLSFSIGAHPAHQY